MNKNATLNLRIDRAVKQDAERVLNRLGLTMTAAIDLYLRQISLTGGIPFAVTLPKAPDSLNMDLMTNEEFKRELKKGFDDIESGDVYDANNIFSEFRNRHSS